LQSTGKITFSFCQKLIADGWTGECGAALIQAVAGASRSGDSADKLKSQLA
jgi:hypothetical protein